MRIDMISEHASPLAALGGADAGGQNVHVSALKGPERPRVPAEDRARILAALECVDAVMASNGNHDRIREAVIAAGSGYRSAGAYRAA